MIISNGIGLPRWGARTCNGAGTSSDEIGGRYFQVE
jgi:hypothetical protein